MADDEVTKPELVASFEIERVPIDAWQLLFDEIGYPPTVTSKTITVEKILDARAHLSANRDFIEALQLIDELGSNDGHEALRDVAAEQHFDDVGSWPTTEGPSAVAIRFFIARRKQAKGGLADAVIARARLQVMERGRVRASHEYAGKEPKPLTAARVKKKEPELKADLKHRFEEGALGSHVQVDCFDDGGELHVQIIRGGLVKNSLTVEEQHDRRKTITYRPAQYDVLRYDPDAGRLRITTRSRRLIAGLREAFGKIFFDDALFFSAEQTCTLAPLVKAGRKALEPPRGSPVARVALRECRVRLGDQTQLHFKGRDCFNFIERYSALVAGADIVEAKLALRLWSSEREVPVTVKVPNRVDFDRRTFADEIDGYLEAVGIRTPMRTDKALDLWSLAPWRHDEKTWRSILPRQFEAFVKNELLKRITLDAVAAPDHPAHGPVLDVVDVAPGTFYGVSDAEDVPSRSLSATQIQGYELDLVAFADTIKRELGLDGQIQRYGVFMDLGSRSFTRVQYRVFLIAQDPGQDGAGLTQFLYGLAKGAWPVLLVPEGRRSGTSWAEVEFSSLTASFAALKDEIIDALGVAEQLTVAERAPANTRLVIDRAKGEVTLDGVVIDLQVGSQPFMFLEHLARRSQHVIQTPELLERIASGREGDAVRKWKKNVVDAITASFKDAKRTPPNSDEVVANERGGYVCRVPAHVG